LWISSGAAVIASGYSVWKARSAVSTHAAPCKSPSGASEKIVVPQLSANSLPLSIGHGFHEFSDQFDHQAINFGAREATIFSEDGLPRSGSHHGIKLQVA